MKRVNFNVTKEEWNKFSSTCRANGETITKVLWRAAQEYVEKHKTGNECDIYSECVGLTSKDCYSLTHPELSLCKTCLCFKCEKSKCPIRQE